MSNVNQQPDQSLLEIASMTFGDAARLNQRLLTGLCQRCDYRFVPPEIGSFCPRCGAARQYINFELERPRTLRKLGVCRGCGLFLGERGSVDACPRCGAALKGSDRDAMRSSQRSHRSSDLFTKDAGILICKIPCPWTFSAGSAKSR